MTITIKGLVWDDWNRKHIAQHDIVPEEVEEVCHGRHKAIESYRGRIQVMGKTKLGKLVTIVLSPEDRNMQTYGIGIYYPITAFAKEVSKNEDS